RTIPDPRPRRHRRTQPRLERHRAGTEFWHPHRWSLRGVFGRRVPDDLPEVSVGVAEVAGVDPPRAIVGSSRESRAGLFGLGQQRIDLGSALDELSDAELARLRWSEGNVGVFGEFAARIEREHEAAFESEYHDRASCV